MTGLSLPPNSEPNLFSLANIAQISDSHFLDVRNRNDVEKIIKEFEPEIILHLAAQALVRVGYKQPLPTFETNVMGTANLLNAIRDSGSVKVALVVTTDKVYQNLERIEPYSETDILGGYDPYSASKAASEIVISSFRDSYLLEKGVAVASARAGNVIGGGDWSSDRLIPDAVHAWDRDLSLEIRRPNAVRPWQHVLEPLNGYLVLAEKLYTQPSVAGAYNFGPKVEEAETVKKVIELANQSYGVGKVRWNDQLEGPHEAGLLTLDITKAHEILGFAPRWNLKEAIQRTMRWYKEYKKGANARELCEADIVDFIKTKESKA